MGTVLGIFGYLTAGIFLFVRRELGAFTHPASVPGVLLFALLFGGSLAFLLLLIHVWLAKTGTQTLPFRRTLWGILTAASAKRQCAIFKTQILLL